MENFDERLKKIFAGTLKLESVSKELSQANCEAWDSINHLNLIIALEAEFKVVFQPEEITGMKDFQTAERMLVAKLNA